VVEGGVGVMINNNLNYGIEGHGGKGTSLTQGDVYFLKNTQEWALFPEE
jgi:hypothetical protein